MTNCFKKKHHRSSPFLVLSRCSSKNRKASVSPLPRLTRKWLGRTYIGRQYIGVPKLNMNEAYVCNREVFGRLLLLTLNVFHHCTCSMISRAGWIRWVSWLCISMLHGNANQNMEGFILLVVEERGDTSKQGISIWLMLSAKDRKTNWRHRMNVSAVCVYIKECSWPDSKMSRTHHSIKLSILYPSPLPTITKDIRIEQQYKNPFKMTQIKVGDYLFKRLHELGIRSVFGVPGGRLSSFKPAMWN